MAEYLHTCTSCGLWFISKDKGTKLCGGASMYPTENCKEANQ